MMSDTGGEYNRSARSRLQFRLRTLLIGVAAVALVLGLATTLATMVGRAREAAARASCNLGGIALAFHNYHDHYGGLPPAVVHGADGEPLYSWRVLILPYLEQRELYEEFRLDEPWNSEHNIRVLKRMPNSFAPPWTRQVEVPPHHTVCHVLVGPKTPFEGAGGVRLPDDFPDGIANTLLFVEAGAPVPWTKPDEIVYDPTQPVRLGGLFRDGFRACTADGSYRFIRHDTGQEILHAMITRNGGERVPLGW